MDPQPNPVVAVNPAPMTKLTPWQRQFYRDVLLPWIKLVESTPAGVALCLGTPNHSCPTHARVPVSELIDGLSPCCRGRVQIGHSPPSSVAAAPAAEMPS